MNIRKLIRLILKIPTTPFVLLFNFFKIMGLSVTLFFQWVYEAKELDKTITKETMSDTIIFLKK